VPPFPTDSDKQGLAQRDLIYRLVAKNTIEEKIVALHHQKRDLADSLLEGTDMGAKSQRMNYSTFCKTKDSGKSFAKLKSFCVLEMIECQKLQAVQGFLMRG
jgi:hypothetical protein